MKDITSRSSNTEISLKCVQTVWEIIKLGSDPCGLKLKTIFECSEVYNLLTSSSWVSCDCSPCYKWSNKGGEEYKSVRSPVVLFKLKYPTEMTKLPRSKYLTVWYHLTLQFNLSKWPFKNWTRKFYNICSIVTNLPPQTIIFPVISHPRK